MRDQLEDPTFACIELLGTIQQIASETVGTQERDKQLAFALYDLFTKLDRLPVDMASQFYERAKEAAGVSASQAALEMFEPGSQDAPDRIDRGPKPKADAIILTVIREEKSAALRAFGIDHRQEPTYEIKGREFFLGKLSRPNAKRDLVFYVTMVGEPQNVPCANACRDIIEKFDVGCLLLSGIAGGLRGKVGQGDVIAPFSIYYTEGGKRHLVPGRGRFLMRWSSQFGRFLQAIAGWVFGWTTRIEPSLSVESSRGSVRGYLQNFEPSLADRSSAFEATLKAYEPAELALAEFKTNFAYTPGMLMCGEKVLVDDSIKQVSEEVDRKIWAVDMESYGFAATCNHCDQEWAVFRGISDYADVKKDDSQHASASIAAAVTARLFLTHAFRPVDERREF